ncbi:zinc ribbon domain-containing protein [Aeromonas bivalvium]|uniref:Zinc ribbon domain-containing protein n=2 Tax=Aeromonas bivalvium TaxID=440079 RepID=A0ABW9GL24_9GAMM|nr:zinc ribbon domain-containing protein [Aeromonas bivalvium]
MNDSTPCCPLCAAALDPRHGEQRCPGCHAELRFEASCPDCGAPLERLQACGAVDYFCQGCSSLISKRRVIFAITPVDE